MNIHTKTALGYIKRSPFQAFAAVFVLSLTFFVATVVSVLSYSSHKSLKYFETRPQIIAFLKKDADSQAIGAMESKLVSDERIKDVKYVAKEDALEIYKKATEDNPLLAELVSPSIFPASLEFSVVDLKLAEDVIKEIQSEAVVESVGFTASMGNENSLGDVVSRLKTITQYIRIGGIVFVATLGLTSFLVLLVIISMRITTRKNEIEILGLIGANRRFIQNPILLEAVYYSVFGVLIGWILGLIMWLYITPSILSYFGEIPVLPRNPLEFFGLFGVILIAEIIAGLCIAFTGTFTALGRSFKKRK